MSDQDCLLTSSQTIGPFPHEAWHWAVEASAQPGAAAVVIAGRLLDGAGEPVNDGWIEAWTPGVVEAGPLPGFRRVPTGEQGEFMLRLSPAVAAIAGHGEPAAHITVFARGLLKHQFSAVFLADAPGLADSALLAQVPEARRASLLARPDLATGHYRWDIRLQGKGEGEGETVFFDYR